MSVLVNSRICFLLLELVFQCFCFGAARQEQFLLSSSLHRIFMLLDAPVQHNRFKVVWHHTLKVVVLRGQGCFAWRMT